MMRRTCARAAWGLGLLYVIAAALPMSSFWYEPGKVVVLDAIEGTSPRVEYWRHIKRPVMIKFAAVIRDANDAAPVCEGGREARLYQPARGVIPDRDLEWWIQNDSCNGLPPGRYWMQTCWTAVTPMRAVLPQALKEPFGWLLPPKSACQPNASEAGNGYTFEIKARPSEPNLGQN